MLKAPTELINLLPINLNPFKNPLNPNSKTAAIKRINNNNPRLSSEDVIVKYGDVTAQSVVVMQRVSYAHQIRADVPIVTIINTKLMLNNYQRSKLI